MKVCILTLATAWGGAELHTVTLARTLAAGDHVISIYELGHNFYDTAKLDGYNRIGIIHLDIPTSARGLKLFAWLRLLRNLDGDVCVFPKSIIEAGGWQLDLAARLLFPRYVTIEHLGCVPMPPRTTERHLGGLIPGVGAWWFRMLVARWFRSFGPHRVVCVSHAMEKVLTEHYRFPVHKVTTIHNGIDPSLYQRVPEARRAIRNALGIPKDALVFGSVGRLHVRKGYDVALEAFHQLISQMPDRDIYFILVGDGPMRSALMRRAGENGLLGRFALLGFTDRPWEAYSAFDIFLMPSSHEGLPLALLEAMACGCCPIATAVGGIPEILTDATLGWLVKPGDPSAFLAMMQAAVQASPEARLEMSRMAREHIVTNFNSKLQYPALAELLEKEFEYLRNREALVAESQN